MTTQLSLDPISHPLLAPQSIQSASEHPPASIIRSRSRLESLIRVVADAELKHAIATSHLTRMKEMLCKSVEEFAALTGDVFDVHVFGIAMSCMQSSEPTQGVEQVPLTKSNADADRKSADGGYSEGKGTNE